MIRCALCGYEFDEYPERRREACLVRSGHETGMVCHSQCPLAERCAIICCPNCGYQVVDETKSGMVSLIRKIEKALSRWPITSPLKK